MQVIREAQNCWGTTSQWVADPVARSKAKVVSSNLSPTPRSQCRVETTVQFQLWRMDVYISETGQACFDFQFHRSDLADLFPPIAKQKIAKFIHNKLDTKLLACHKGMQIVVRGYSEASRSTSNQLALHETRIHSHFVYWRQVPWYEWVTTFWEGCGKELELFPA